MTSIAEALRNRRNSQNNSKLMHGVPPPLSPEVDYRKELLGMLKSIDDQIQRDIYPLLTYYAPQYVQDTPRQDVLKQVNYISDQLLKPVENFAKTAANTFVGNVASTNKKRFQDNFNKSFGFSVPKLLKDEKIVEPVDSAIKENVNLIVSIPQEYLGRVKIVISAGMTQGRTAGDIRNQLRDDAFGISERRVRLIARDQTSKINGQLTQIRAQDIGSDDYIWMGRNDALERETHRENNNKKFSWRNPPITGHPGADYQCRCWAKLIITF